MTPRYLRAHRRRQPSTCSWCSRTRTAMAQKLATKYKFGKKRKRKTPYNFQKRSAVPQSVPDHDENDALPESSDAEGNKGALGLVPRSAPDSGRGVSSTFQQDTAMLQPENLRRIDNEAQGKLPSTCFHFCYSSKIGPSRSC